MIDFLRERIPRLFRRKESKLTSKDMHVLGEYNLGNIIAFSSEFSLQAKEMMEWAGELRARHIVETIRKEGPNPNKHHLVPTVSIVRRGNQHFLRYMQEWRNELDQPDVGVTTGGNEIPISRSRAREITRRYSQFNEFDQIAKARL